MLVGRNIWGAFKTTVHCIKNILMPEFKKVINDSGTNLEDALNKTRWAHWAYKTNAAAKLKKKKQEKGMDAGSKTDMAVVTPDDCHCKETYTFAEYETFAIYYAHPLMERAVHTLLWIVIVCSFCFSH
jgi:hypothetical protein